MKAAEIRELSSEDIHTRLEESREEMMNFRFQQATGELVDFTRIRHTGRLIARFITILKEREREATLEGES